MFISRIFYILFLFTVIPMGQVASSCSGQVKSIEEVVESEPSGLRVGAERTESYLTLLQGKRVAVVGNHSSLIGSVHLVDSLLSLGINVIKVFGPEHGFRGDLPDGEHIASGKDAKTGLDIVSLYGNNRKPTAQLLADVDYIVFDIQDMGVRFYTYISTLSLVMEAAAAQKIPVVVLDRPNPHRHYVDGPVLEVRHSSFVGMHQVPVVYGMTIGEYAMMVNGEGWLGEGIKCELQVISIENYTSQSDYIYPVAPSPNLPNMRAMLLYPSLCFFEGTIISVGRGTDIPFQVFGHPDLPSEKYIFGFVPEVTKASSKPPLLGQRCNGLNFENITLKELKARNTLDISFLLEAYKDFPEKGKFFNNYFTQLAGTTQLQEQVKNGVDEQTIRASWQPQIDKFKEIRKKYLLYPDFD